MASEPPRAASLSPRTSVSTPALKGLNTPLSSKVTSVLSASYADSEFRDSLALLDERHVQNNAETRRRLRLDIQKEVIESNGAVIAEFGRVAEQLRRIGSTIDKLNKTYDGMKAEIDVAHSATKPVLDEASSLIDRRRHVENRRRLLNAFVGHFILTEDEVAALTLTAEPVDDRFFAVLKKAKKISKDCEVLLGFEEEDNQPLGLEIMEQTSKNINLGFQKLYKWVQREFKNLNLENPQIGSAMSRALRVLAERPSLFQSCLDSFADARESILSDAFYTALVGSGDSGSDIFHAVKPIELAAHDPLRYAGDMLAWTHSATVSEREALESLFVADSEELAREIQEGRENEMWRITSGEENQDPDVFDPVKALNDLVDRDLSGVARILRQRMGQVIQTNEDTILAYKLANLLNFYHITFTKLVGSGSDKSDSGSEKFGLVATLDGLEADALRHFRSLIRDRVASLSSEFEQAPSDPAPPEFLQDALEQLESIMKTYDTSLIPFESRESGFVPILTEALDPFLAGCDEIAKKAPEPLSSLMLSINCLSVARETLSTFDFTAGRTVTMQADIDSKARALGEIQYDFFCQQSGLDEIFTALEPFKTGSEDDLRKVVKLDLLQPESLMEASQHLDDFLPSALMDAIENIKPLQDPRLARRLTEEAADRFCVNFEHVEEVLDAADKLLSEEDESRDPETALRVVFPRTSVEIRVLLS